MDNKKDDWMNDTQNSEMSSCGCGSDTGTGYAAADSMKSAGASSMQDKSSNQFKDQGYQGSESRNTDQQQSQDNISGKSCKADRMDNQSDLDNDVVYIETITAIYGPDEMDDSDYQGQSQDQEIKGKSCSSSDSLSDM